MCQSSRLVTWLVVVAAFYLPHLIFLIYKIGQSLFSPASKVYLYDSVCYDRFSDEPFILISHQQNGSYRFNWTLASHHVKNLSSFEPEKNTNYTVAVATCSNLTGPAQNFIQLDAANYIMAMKILQNVPAFILGMFCGGWMDRVGQKVPMILSCLGGAVVAVAFVIIHLSGQVAIPGILVGITINSFTGRNTLVTTAIQSFISDRTVDDERTKQLSYILAMNFFGLFGGSLIMGLMADDCPFWSMFLVVAIFYIVALLLIIFFLPNGKQNHRPDNDEKTGLVSDNAIKNETPSSSSSGGARKFMSTMVTFFKIENFTDTLKTIFRNRPNNLRRYIILTFVCILLQNVCKSGEVDVLLLFVRHSPLNWTGSGYGYLLTYQYASVGLMLIFLLPFLLSYCHLSDSTIVIGSTLIKALGLLLLAFSSQTWMVYVASTFVSTFGIIISCLRAIVSKMVDDNESGRCFAIIASVEVASDLIGVVLFTRLYNIGLVYKNVGTSLPFIVMAGIHVILFALSLFVYLGIRKLPSSNEISHKNEEILTTKLTTTDPDILPETDVDPPLATPSSSERNLTNGK